MKKLVSILLFVVILCGFNFSAKAAGSEYQDEATILNSLGLFNGSDKGFELERTPSRIEAAVMLVRLLGKEKLALDQANVHPFADVPNWADAYIGYLYVNKLTLGKGNNLFGSGDSASWKDYLTFVLRSLGYRDSEGDFTYDTSLDKAEALGILNTTKKVNTADTFVRGNMVYLSYKALFVTLNKDSKTLAQKLSDEGVFDIEAGMKAGVIKDENQAYVTLTFSNYTSERYNNIQINREQLPLKMQDFYKIGVTGIDNKQTELYKYLMTKVSVERADKSWIKPYNDDTGNDIYYFKNSLILFYDTHDVILGRCFLYEYPAEGAVNVLCESINTDELTPPPEYINMISSCKTLPYINTGFKAMKYGDDHAFIYIDEPSMKMLLPTVEYFGFSTATKASALLDYGELVVYNFMYGKRYHITDLLHCLETAIAREAGYTPDNTSFILTLYDIDLKLIGYKMLSDSDFVNSDQNFYCFKGEYYGEDTNNCRLTIKRFINGIEDTSNFIGYSMNLSESESSEYYDFVAGFFYVPNDTVTYTISSEDGLLKNAKLVPTN